jgi:hypothetical protein
MPIIIGSAWDADIVQSIARMMPTDKARKWEVQAGHLFFKHRRAAYHRSCIEQCYARMIGEMPKHFKETPIEEGTNSSYAGPLLEIMLFHMDSFFEAERSGYDFVLNCLRTAELFKDSTPKSFRKFYDKETKSPNTYPCDYPHLRSELISFWENTGLRLTEYRDCLTHFLTLSGATWQHAVNMRWLNGSWKAAFELPDNPKETSLSSLTFDLRLDARDVCSQLNRETDNFLRRLMAICAERWNVTPGENQNRQMTVVIRLGE